MSRWFTISYLAFFLVALLHELAIASKSGSHKFETDIIHQRLLVASTGSQIHHSCLPKKRKFDPFHHKQTYQIGVHAIRGFTDAFHQYNLTFSEYLTMTAGQRFDPPIRFEMVAYTFEDIFKAIDNEELDFFYANPSVFSCIGTEMGASSLATIISHLKVRGETYDLDVFGGVIAARADNDKINTIIDLKDKVIGAGAISMIMAAQLQFYEMNRAGLSYVNDPKQMVFTHNQFDVVTGVLNGEFDVGFVRTDTIERTRGENGDLLDPNNFKIIEPKVFVMDDGSLFPFLHSTSIYPEWPVAALNTVPSDVAYEVQRALLAIESHAKVGLAYQDCLSQNETTLGFDVQEYCDGMDFPYDFDRNARCDTTKPVAMLSAVASEVGSFAGFRTSKSYFQARDMLQEARFLLQNDKGEWYCTRHSNLYDSISCPEGHFKRSPHEFELSCNQAGLKCAQGYDCYCKPCVKAYEVDVYEYFKGEDDYHLIDHYGDKLRGCAKMSICGVVQQGNSITLRVYDNMKRDGATVKVIMHAGDLTKDLDVTNLPGTYAYEVSITEQKVQVEVIEFFLNGIQIPQSPIRVRVVERNCDEIFGPNSQREPDNNYGICLCKNDTYEVSGECIQSQFFFLIIFACVSLGVGVLVLVFLDYKRQQGDSVWHISAEELHFNEPPEVIGQGAFGVVILGQYRGTNVAVKRVIPRFQKKAHGSNQGSRTSLDANNVRNVESSRSSLRSNKSLAWMMKSVKSVHDTGGGTEAPRGTKSEKESAASMKLSSNYKWSSIVNTQKYDSPIKILEAATASNHGDSSLLCESANKSQSRLYRCLPLWLRFDKHSRLRRDFLAEMRLLSRLRHPCITTVMGAVISSNVDPMLVMEYMDYGSLFDLLHNKTIYTGGDVILQIMRDIVQGIQFLHAFKPPILHGDLKAKNILVDSRFRAKVADFGFSHIKKEGKTNILQGTPFYMAPEYLQRRTEYNPPCDIYALSMVLYEIYGRAEPFEGEDPRKVLPKVCHPRINKRPAIPDACPPKMVEIIKRCWSANPFFRPSARDLDYILVELTAKDTEPLEKNKTFKESMGRKPTSLYDIFPKHIADLLNRGKRVEPESHEVVTVIFSDIVDFADILQEFPPLKVSNMLDRLYQVFDELANKHQIFKVETIGDAYMGVANLDGTQYDSHVKCVAEYAIDAIAAASKIQIDEDAPERGYVKIRVGFHSGPVVSNVIGSLNPRYGLFGDTVNTASRMETNSAPSRILCTYTSAKLLETQAPDIPLSLRGMINIKGKGNMMTYWVGSDIYQVLNDTIPETLPCLPSGHREIEIGSILQEAMGEDSHGACSIDTVSSAFSQKQRNHEHCVDEAQERVSKMLMYYLLLLAASRPNKAEQRSPEVEQAINYMENDIGRTKTPLEEASEYVPVAENNGQYSQSNSTTITFNKKAEEQLYQYVSAIASMHNSNAYHNLEHAALVMEFVHKLLTHVVTPDADFLTLADGQSFGINNDKLAQFSLILCALIHSVDHRGIPNLNLAKENHPLNFRYEGKALAEQNAADLGWEVLMSPEFAELRSYIYTTEDELSRFRNFFVNLIIATDIFDPDLAKHNCERWERAFVGVNQTKRAKSNTLEDIGRRSTNILEHLIRAGAHCHVMQDWEVYIKWNERLFKELTIAHKLGRVQNNPASTWFEEERKFFDNLILPIVEKLCTCGVFGSSGDEFLKCAKSNREKWVAQGKTIVKNMSKEIKVGISDAIPSMV